MQPVRIVFIVPQYNRLHHTGSQQAIREMAEQLAGLKHMVTVVTSDARTSRYWYDPVFGSRDPLTRETMNGVHVIRIPCRQLISAACFFLSRYTGFLLPEKLRDYFRFMGTGPILSSLLPVLASLKPDVVHVSPMPFAVCWQAAAAIRKIKPRPVFIITPFHHTEMQEYRNPLIREPFMKADRIHVVTQSEGKWLKEYFVLPANKFFHAPLGIPVGELTDAARLQPEADDFRNKHNLSGKKIILFIGNKGRYKGIIHLAEAIKNIQRVDSKIALVAAGASLPEWNKFAKSISGDWCLDLGPVSEKEKEILYAACDVFCMPSVSESFGLTYFEAWHKKKPVIAADLPSSGELISRSRGGLLVPYGNIRLLEEALVKLINNKNLAMQYGKNGSDYLKNNPYEKIMHRQIALFAA